MHRARRAYGALIRAPIVGPLVRLPLRLLRWLVQSPDLDPAVRADRLARQVDELEVRLGELNIAHQALQRDQERARLVLFMLSGQLLPSTEPDAAHAAPARQPAPRVGAA